ncbi:ureidoglycolate lyase [Aquibacillus koreensis]|uniref:Ureidoglycolate lyase n=1 Tax=Aquibacillus koreensis TaxID=279446 RepID=A0A9X3WH44_9BACI|nr:ureidoglycolate lyase [Aquibacillus koreensis]MCT2534733.1 ureidoglycolate lyase [Aquibacillus koreensis]MDC3419657.1 ureidoglycolate lyase [Aquibacillus koreensis]
MLMEIKVEPLTKEGFKDYGRVVEIPDAEPSKVGEGWECWSYVQTMDIDTEVGMGLVTTNVRPFEVDSMERHDSREELLLAINEDIIQPVATYKELYSPDEQPEVENVKCFYLKKGQGIILNKGIWHSPAYPAKASTTYLFAIEKKPDIYGDELIDPWVEFVGSKKIAFK